MATRWSENRKLPAGLVLFTLSLVILGCDREATPSAPAGLLASPEARAAGAAIYASSCAICHGPDADGRGQRREGMSPAPGDLTMPPWSDTASAGRTFLAIRNGVPRTAMPPWPTLSDQQIWQVVAYITSLKKGA
jgi:cytochrome c oxidase cbb3-type subunit 2